MPGKKIVIVEDDPFALEMLTDLLDHYPDYLLAGTFSTVKSAVKSIPALAPELIFLDMELPDGKGFDILQNLPEINFEIIITTAHDAYMLQAFRHSALDYLLKPVNAQEFGEALARFEAKKSPKSELNHSSHSSQPNKIVLAMNEELLVLDIGDIVRLESERSYTTFFTKDKKKFTTSRTMATYEPKLLPNGFFRVHHSHLINLNYIDKYIKGEGGYVIMADGTHVEVSRRKKEEFLRALGL